MEERNYLIILYDYYGVLFNEKQRTCFERYYFDNLSLAEISEALHISRNGVHKQLKVVEAELHIYEQKLKLYDKRNKINKIIKKINNEKIEEEILELI